MDVRGFILSWNLDFPVDHWWRDKHQIAFNSSAHRSSCIMDMYMEYLEDLMYIEIYEKRNKKENKEEDIDNIYIPGSGKIFKKEKPKQMTEQEFADLDLAAFNG